MNIMSQKEPVNFPELGYKWIMSAIFIALFAGSAGKIAAQPIPVGSIQEQQFRILQLLSDSTILTSMNGRPIWNRTYQTIFTDPKIQQYNHSWWAHPLKGYEKKLSEHWKFGIYNPVITNTFNSQLPYGGNNGSAWYGRGFNEEFQGGFYLTSRYITLTFRPHISLSQNNSFPIPRFVTHDKNGNPKYTYTYFRNNIDLPYRFGPDSFADFNLGLTSLSIHYKSIAAGISKGTLWWGPAVRNALMLSNNAPGMRHAFFGTREPLKFPLGIGRLEFKFIWALPKDSKYFPTTKATNHQRFGAGLNVNFSPGFAPNLSLGITRFSWRYIPDGGLQAKAFLATLPFFNHRQIKNKSTHGRVSDSQNQMFTVYVHWFIPKANAEIYGEFYREDSYYNLRGFFLEPDHDRSFTLGFEKLVESNGWFNLFKFNAELNNLVPDRTSQVHRQSWPYTHGIIKQGHTNQGQVLGASIGPGSSSQYFGAEGYFEKGSIGLFIQRVAVNDFFHFKYYNTNKITPHGRIGAKDPWRHRINLNIGITGRYKTGPVLLSGGIIWNKNYNYGRYDYGKFNGINFKTVNKHDLLNMQIQVKASFFF